jgi:hypothetical protein
LRSKIASRKKDDTNGLSTSHDLAAVDKIRELRRKTVRRIEDAEAFFLTSDFGLQRTVLFGLGHNDSGTLTEVVLDRVLANILWLKNPKLSLPLSTIIATHSRDLLIDRKVWDKFYAVLGKLRSEGVVTEGQVENLFYHRNVASLLQELGRGDTEKINDALIMEAVEEATKSLSEKEKSELSARTKIESELFEIQTQHEKEAQDYNTKLIDIKTGLRRKAGTSANVSVTSGIILLFIIAVVLEFVFLGWLPEHLSPKHLSVLNSIYSGIGVFFLGATGTVCWALRKIAIPWVQEILYKRLLKQVSLD